MIIAKRAESITAKKLKINKGADFMDEIRTETKKTFEARLAEEMAKVPDDQKEVVAALLLGTCQGVQIAAQMQQQATA